ncbi:glycoside hydrolase family 2 TIM barrel-domain containing protein [Cellvibrio sp. PSBB006]|uniref:glycoside hydrolase family 2 protein n=1 Tax=Cellvibrio sp. PSBB006 TaxID=1987723 RepID=UPI000B3B14DC|nr:glycoside hydrolase family 2 TIM barrel-domain containing protein [Cellvibrio sp. PSBB006]ARU28851.1 glycoside hydrolase family 2 [Cellvibrio sp. PSBB006]
MLGKSLCIAALIGSSWLLAACTPTSQSTPDTRSAASEQRYNQDWQFLRSDDSLSLTQVQGRTDWQEVTLPHTSRIEPLIVNDQFQGDAWYRKMIDGNSIDDQRPVWLRFEAAMNVAEVWLNGEKLTMHVGGYLPFTAELTGKLTRDQNELLVRLDNRDNPITGPKPLATLDFNTYGGLYRDVYLVTKDDLYITDPIAADKQASGGIFVTYPKVSPTEAHIAIQTHVRNAGSAGKTFQIKQVLLDGKRIVTQTESKNLTVPANNDQESRLQLTLTNPNLWSPKQPHLYTLVTQVFDGQEMVDEQHTRIGIREFRFTDDGSLLINGEKTFLRGINRHQEYPYVGYATSAAADYRDAVKIKSAGFDYVRLSHYPHSRAFMAAADELGLVLIDAILGWQYFSEDPAFQTQIQQTCRDLIRRDRNHPSVLAWECSLNESWMSESFIDSLQKIVHEEYPGNTTYSAGWQEYGYDIYLQARQHRLEHYKTPTKPYVVSEYGDWEYYAMNAGLNQDAWGDLLQADRSSRQLLGDGEKRLLQQATNIQEAHNDNLTTPAFADGYWVMFDYNRGYADDLEASGIMSIHRRPKYSYYFFQSQRDPQDISDHYESGPMVHIASRWQADSPLDLRVFSNAEEVELVLNGKSLGKQTPDKNANTKYLKHPPFTFDLKKFEAGELSAKAFINGKLVAEHKVVTPGKTTQITLDLDTRGKAPQAGVKDLVFVYAQLLDEKGNPTYDNDVEVTFSTQGDIRLVSSDKIKTEAGVASALIEIGDDLEDASVSAVAGNAEFKFRIR